MFKNGFQINPDIPLLHTKVEKDYMPDLMVEFSEKDTCNDEKTRWWKMLEVRHLSDAVNAAAVS